MAFVAATIVPIFGLIAVGWLIARLRLLIASAADGLSSFVFVIAMPVLLFRTIATADFGEASPALLWLAYFGGVAVIFPLGILVGRRFAGLDRRASVIAGVAASFSNIVLVGIPITERAFGREGLDIVALLLSVHLPIMAVLAALLMERAALADEREAAVGPATGFRPLPVLKRVGVSLARNPLIVGIGCGILVRILGLELSGPIGGIVQSLASTAGPLALVTLGLSLARYGIGGSWRTPALLCGLALLLQPAVVFLLASLLSLPPLWRTVAVLAAAAPSGVNAYLFAVYYKIDPQLATTSIVATTVLSAGSLALWLALVAG